MRIRPFTLSPCHLVTLSLLALTAACNAADPPAPRLIPVEGADGWASTAINTIIFRYFPLATHNGIQYTAYYDNNSHVVLAKRKISEDKWQVKVTSLTANTRDAHNTISLALDSTGILHMSWDHHGNNLNYVRTTTPDSLELTDKLPMDGTRETQVTYPQFFNTPSGDLLFLYRVGSSGNGDLVLKRYQPVEKKWFTVQQNLIAGENRQNAYPEFCVGADGTLHLGWTWRASPDVATNHDICYTRSTDGGKTWTDSAGKPMTLPITAATGEIAFHIPQNSDLMNQTTIAADAQGHPYIATYFRPEGQTIPQIAVVYHDGKQWQKSQVGTRTGPFTLAGGGTRRVPLSRPLILTDASTPAKVYVLFRDADRQERVTLASTGDIAKNPWSFTDLTTDAYGYWEPSLDMSRWQADHILDIFLQKTDQPNGDTVNQVIPPTKVNILEYKP